MDPRRFSGIHSRWYTHLLDLIRGYMQDYGRCRGLDLGEWASWCGNSWEVDSPRSEFTEKDSWKANLFFAMIRLHY